MCDDRVVQGNLLHPVQPLVYATEMDKILERLSQHQNWLFGILVGIVGLFLVALLMSGDWDTVAQALGNIIGAAIGTIGAAGAIVWQMGKHDRQRANELRTLRRAALRHIERDLLNLSIKYQAAANHLVKGDHRQALIQLMEIPTKSFTIEPALEVRLRDLSPGDEIERDAVKVVNQRVYGLVEQINRMAAPPDQALRDLAVAIDTFPARVLEFIEATEEGIESNAMLIEAFKHIRKTIAQISGFEKFPRFAWLFRPQ